MAYSNYWDNKKFQIFIEFRSTIYIQCLLMFGMLRVTKPITKTNGEVKNMIDINMLVGSWNIKIAKCISPIHFWFITKPNKIWVFCSYSSIRYYYISNLIFYFLRLFNNNSRYKDETKINLCCRTFIWNNNEVSAVSKWNIYLAFFWAWISPSHSRKIQ